MIRTLVFLAAAAVSGGAFAATGSVELYRDPSCGCCAAHADYLRDHGFDVEVIATDELASVKSEHGVPDALAGCHTAVADGYVFEGHVPADSFERVLEERPAIVGVSVPGMPAGSPGMGGELRAPLRVWTIPAAGDAPAVHATYDHVQ